MPSLKRQCKIAMPGSRGLKAGGSSVIKGLSLAVNVFFKKEKKGGWHFLIKKWSILEVFNYADIKGGRVYFYAFPFIA